MTARPIDEAELVFAKHLSGISECVEAAYKKFIEKFGQGLSLLETVTKHKMVRDLIVGELRTWADKTRGVQYFKNGNLKWFEFENNWIVRVKHVDHNFCVGVSRTEDSRSYNRNIVPDTISNELPDAPATALYLGWKTNDNTPMSPEIALVCNNEYEDVGWVLPIKGEGLPPTLELPIAGDQTGTRVLIKKSAKPVNKGK